MEHKKLTGNLVRHRGSIIEYKITLELDPL